MNERRIEFICSLIPSQAEIVWDLCCDHGNLGIDLLEKKKVRKVNFVDCVPSIMEKLEKRLLSRNFSDAVSYNCLTLDAHKIIVENNNDVVVICGVGGQLAGSLVKSILTNNPSFSGDFFISAHYHIYELRKTLLDLGLKLESETLIQDKARFYEVIHTSFRGKKAISLTGREMWDFNREADCNYLKKIISHYERKRHSCANSEKIVNDYLKLKNEVLL